MAGGHGPLDQFRIKSWAELPPLFGEYNIDFTNSAFFMCLATGLTIFFMMMGMRGRALVPGRWQSMVELSYQFIATTVRDNVGTAGKPYFPLVFTLFMFVLMCNLLGMMPYAFTATSHIIVTFALAMFVFVGVTLLAFFKHGFKFFGFFLPAGTPWWMAPMMILIELVSYLSRPISLSIRLCANMSAGHIVMKIFAGFIMMMSIAGVVPFALLVVLTGFEIGIAILHAYIFTVLSCVYLNDALHLHH